MKTRRVDYAECRELYALGAPVAELAQIYGVSTSWIGQVVAPGGPGCHQKAYRERNRAAIAERTRRYRAANLELMREWERAYREANREKLAAYREANRERIRARDRAFYAANRERILERRRARAADAAAAAL